MVTVRPAAYNRFRQIGRRHHTARRCASWHRHAAAPPD